MGSSPKKDEISLIVYILTKSLGILRQVIQGGLLCVSIFVCVYSIVTLLIPSVGSSPPKYLDSPLLGNILLNSVEPDHLRDIVTYLNIGSIFSVIFFSRLITKMR